MISSIPLENWWEYSQLQKNLTISTVLNNELLRVPKKVSLVPAAMKEESAMSRPK